MDERRIRIGLVGESEGRVTEAQSAQHLGSGSMRVFATPAMALLIEEVSRKAIEPLLADGQATVGIEIHVRHLAPTPIGSTIRVRSQVTAVEGNLVTFRAEVWDAQERVGEAEHTRAVIDLERFQRRVAAKAGGEPAPTG
jgi:fluoroacetyl-CoA thioesterase